MKKLIETYCVKQSVVPAAIQLIFKGNPVHESDTPEHLNLCSDDVLEVCRVPGIPLKDHTNERKNEPDVKMESSSPVSKSPVDETNRDLMVTTKNEYITRLLSKGFVAPSNGKTSPKRPAPDSRAQLGLLPPGILAAAAHAATSAGPDKHTTSPTSNPSLKNSHLNLEMLNYPFPHSPNNLNNVTSTDLRVTSNNNNNQVAAHQSRKITELELELTQTKLKTTELARFVQFLQARLILSERASEEKELVLKQKDKTIEQLRLELERREQIFRAYGIGGANTNASASSTPASSTNVESATTGSSSRKSPKSAGSSVGSNSSQRTSESLNNVPGPSWK